MSPLAVQDALPSGTVDTTGVAEIDTFDGDDVAGNAVADVLENPGKYPADLIMDDILQMQHQMQRKTNCQQIGQIAL